MKKLAIIFALVFALSFSVFADGDMNTGGRICQPNQTEQNCPIDPPNNSNAVTTNTTNAENSGENEEQSVLDDIFDYLNSLFG